MNKNLESRLMLAELGQETEITIQELVSLKPLVIMHGKRLYDVFVMIPNLVIRPSESENALRVHWGGKRSGIEVERIVFQECLWLRRRSSLSVYSISDLHHHDEFYQVKKLSAEKDTLYYGDVVERYAKRHTQ